MHADAAIRLLRSPLRKKLLAAEATAELIRARLDTLRPATHYTRILGTLGETAAAAADRDVGQAHEIGHVTARVAGFMPFRALCLQQALAVRRMLRRRSIPATVYLGVARASAGQLREADATDIAHAWVSAGDTVISGGDADLSRFVVVGVFG